MGFTWEPIPTDLHEVEIMTSIAFFFDQEMRGKVFGSIYRALEILKDHPESYPISKNTFEISLISETDRFPKLSKSIANLQSGSFPLITFAKNVACARA